MRRALVVGSGAFVLAVGSCGLWLSRDAEPSLSTDTHSEQLKTAGERVAFLSRYLKLRTPISDAAFHVVYHDNSGGLVPGPSDWWISAVLRARPGDEPQWLVGATPVLALNSMPPAALPQRIPPSWGVTSQGARFRRDRSTLIWHEEGVLELSVRSEP